MGFLGRLLSFVRAERNGAKLSDVKIDLGGGEILTANYAQPSGEDSQPLPDDTAVVVRLPQSGRVLIVAMVESDAVQSANAGEKRLYARDAARGEVVQLWLKNDGTAVLSNDNGSFTLFPDGSQKGANESGYYELKSDGTMDINTATIDPEGNIKATSVHAPSIVADGKELTEHDHDINDGSSAPGPTGANNK